MDNDNYTITIITTITIYNLNPQSKTTKCNRYQLKSTHLPFILLLFHYFVIPSTRRAPHPMTAPSRKTRKEIGLLFILLWGRQQLLLHSLLQEATQPPTTHRIRGKDTRLEVAGDSDGVCSRDLPLPRLPVCENNGLVSYCFSCWIWCFWSMCVVYDGWKWGMLLWEDGRVCVCSWVTAPDFF